ncbi:MAG TPA: hypothetical protein VN493_09745 [Thermoanaerobaculia bacterium]|nr:hypothetical protein [Thermoanaerobaculia bacterium]
MKRLGILTLLALSLLAAVPAQASDPADIEATPAVAAPLVLTIEDEAADLASLGAGEVIYASSFCMYCPAYPEDCLDPRASSGQACSDPGMNCSCQFCGGEFGCFFN